MTGVIGGIFVIRVNLIFYFAGEVKNLPVLNSLIGKLEKSDGIVQKGHGYAVRYAELGRIGCAWFRFFRRRLAQAMDDAPSSTLHSASTISAGSAPVAASLRVASSFEIRPSASSCFNFSKRVSK